MTVLELVNRLKLEDPEREVMFAYPYYDRLEVCSMIHDVGSEEVVWSAYHDTYCRRNEDSEEDDADHPAKDVVVIQ